MTSVDGGIIPLIVYIFVPFGAIASRSFQPDPLMVMWLVLAWWAFCRWYRVKTWRAALMAGLFAGIAMLIKSVAIFLLLGGMAALLIQDQGIKRAIKDIQAWMIAGLSALPVVVYTLYGLYGLGLSSQFSGRFFPELLINPSHYIRWASEMMAIVGFAGLILGLIGTFLFRKPYHRAFVAGLWGGYVLYGLFFPYHFLTHNYYHLPLIPLVALSLAPLAEGLFKHITSVKLNWMGKSWVFGVIFLGIALQLWDIRVELARSDYRHEPAYWASLGEKVGREHEVIALTHDYGDRIFYYGWLKVHNWPETGQISYKELRSGKTFEFESWFEEQTEGMDYFLVTRIKDLERQTELKEMLYNHYELIDQGDGYLLFDVKQSQP
jgi:4-amino-4-deoxy-L-arabinose transferase-like glycosyltransferase